jgi:hypothetical protein
MNNPAGPITRMQIVADYLNSFSLRYCAPVFIGLLTETNQRMSASGTALLLQIGDRPFLVTDDHVLAEYDREHGRDPAVAFQIGAARFDPAKRLVDRSEEKDLCVLDGSDLTPNDRADSEGEMPPLEFYRVEASAWPPPIVNQGESVIWAGYPGRFRKQDGFDVVSASLSCAAAPVTGVLPNYFSNLDRTTWTTKFVPDDPNLKLMDWGGMSGGPVFVDGPTTLRPLLVGFIMEHFPDGDQLKMSHAALIQRDGSIVRGSLF